MSVTGIQSSGNTVIQVNGGTTAVSISSNGISTLLSLAETKGTITSSNIDLSTGNYFAITISGTTSFTVTNVPASSTAVSFILDITNGGSATVNWLANTRWASGTAPTLTSAGRDVLGFFTYDSGANWSGFVLSKNLS